MLDKAKIYQTRNGRIYFDKKDNSWWYCPEGNFLTTWANMGHPKRADAVLARAEGQSRITEKQASAEINA